MIDLLIDIVWGAILILGGYKLAEHRYRDVQARMIEARADGYTEGVTDTINSIKKLSVGTIIANLKRR